LIAQLLVRVLLLSKQLLKIQKNFRSLCTLVIKILSCCSIFNELCVSSLSSLTAYLLYHTRLPLSRAFLNFFQVFFAALLLFLCAFRSPATAYIVYHISPPLSTPFLYFFSLFFCLFYLSSLLHFLCVFTLFLSFFYLHQY